MNLLAQKVLELERRRGKVPFKIMKEENYGD